MNVNVNVIEEKIIQIKIGITINVNVSVKNVIYVKKIIHLILLYAVAKIVNIYAMANVIGDSVIIRNEIIEETKTVPTNSNEGQVTCKTQNLYILFAFSLITITLLICIHCLYLLLPDKISSKTKTFITISQITN